MNFKNIKLITLLTFALVCLPLLASAQSNGTIRGTITTDVNREAVGGVSVEITQLRRTSETDENGTYEFTNIPPGRYTLVTHIEGFSDRAQTVVLVGGATAAVDFSLSLTALREEVTVTATGAEESVFESFQSVTAVGSTRIREQANTSIGEVLEREAGVSKRSFGPGTSRPSIRGFEGDRVLVLQDGIRNGSVGSQSGDHGEPVDTLNLERLEVIKGPATLLYGSSAIGGVVNAVSGDENDAHEGFRGAFTGLGGTVNRQGRRQQSYQRATSWGDDDLPQRKPMTRSGAPVNPYNWSKTEGVPAKSQEGKAVTWSPGQVSKPAAITRPTPTVDPTRTAQFKRNDSIQHAKFGVGTVIESTLTRDDEEVTIAFPGVGVKKLLISLAGLKKL